MRPPASAVSEHGITGAVHVPGSAENVENLFFFFLSFFYHAFRSDNSECCGDIKRKKNCNQIQRKWVQVTGYLLSESLLLLQDSELHLLPVHGFVKRVLCLLVCLSLSCIIV
jgi:hypothetical protein